MDEIYSRTPHLWPAFLTVLLLLILSAYSGRRRSVPGALPFAIGSLLAVLCVVGSGLEDAATTTGAKIAWFKFQVAWHLPAVTVMACFVLEYTWPGRWLTRRTLALLAIAPLLTLGLIVTDHLHHQAWRSFAFDGALTAVPGPITWLFIGYAYALSLIEILAFACLFRHSPPHRWPVAIMLTGLIGARILYLLDVTGAVRSQLPLDLVLIAYLFLMYALALFGFHILDPIPLARQTVIVQMRQGVLVLDPQGQVASVNPAAERILGLSAKSLLGRLVPDLLPASTASGAGLLSTEVGRAEIRLDAGLYTRDYEVETTPLKDWRGLAVGRLLLLHDITAQKQAQAQLVEQQRAVAMLHEREQLARELHDNMGQIFAFVNTQGQTIRRLLSRGDVAAADACVGRLVEVAREADVDIRESILGLRVTLSAQGLFPALASYLALYEKNYGIHVELDTPEACMDGVCEPLVEVQLLRIVQEALTNVRKHASARCVCITVGRADGDACITVRDDGQGFDPAGSDDRGGEHIGLRVMRERAAEVGGSVSVRSIPGQGTAVVVRVPGRGAIRPLDEEGAGDG